MIRQIRGEFIILRVASLDYDVLTLFYLPRWKGKLDGREGSFPANFVEVV